jgi:hypothetical protein
MKIQSLAALALMLAAIPSTRADVIYTFNGFNRGPTESTAPDTYTNPISFKLTAPDFITENTSFGVGQNLQCDGGGLLCQGVAFNMSGAYYGVPNSVYFEFITDQYRSIHYFSTLDAQPFASPGIYTTATSFNTGVLTVTATIPEPTSLSLGLLGFLAICASFLRNKRIDR